MSDHNNSDLINWTKLAESLGTISSDGESGGSENARKALELIIGETAIKNSVDHYISHEKGSEIARSVLWLIRPWSAMLRCKEIYDNQNDIEARRTAIELLRVISDRRVLPWIEEFLNDPDEVIQSCGAGVVDQLLWSELVEQEDCDNLLEIMANHSNEEVRNKHEFVIGFLKERGHSA